MTDPDYDRAKKLKIRLAKGNTLNYAEKNFLIMYDKRMSKSKPKDDEPEA